VSTVLGKTLDLQLEVVKKFRSHTLLAISRDEKQKSVLANCKHGSRFPGDEDHTKPGQVMHDGIHNEMRECSTISHDFNGKRCKEYITGVGKGWD
jgi:hypothetical protein